MTRFSQRINQTEKTHMVGQARRELHVCVYSNNSLKHKLRANSFFRCARCRGAFFFVETIVKNEAAEKEWEEKTILNFRCLCVYYNLIWIWISLSVHKTVLKTIQASWAKYLNKEELELAPPRKEVSEQGTEREREPQNQQIHIIKCKI